MVPIFQFTSRLCLTNQLCPRNMFMLFKSVTAMSIYSLCLLISTSSSANHVTFPFLVPSVLKTSNNMSASFVLIHSFLTNCLLISMYMYLEFTSACNHNSFSVCVFTFACMFKSFSLLFCQCKITYQLWALVIWVLCTMPTQDHFQNPALCCLFQCLILPKYYNSLSFVLIDSL